jgi:two-component system sensor histidine kinase SenX3
MLPVMVAVVVGLVAGVLLGLWARRSPEPVAPSPVPPVPEPVAEPDDDLLPGPLAQAVDRVEHGVVVVDGFGGEIYRNLAAQRIGSARDGRTLVENTLRRLLTEARQGSSHRESVELFGPPAQLYLVAAYPFQHETGVGALAVVEDRSDARRTETVRRDFVANISHELKTPVGAIGLLAETILGEDDPEVRQRLARRMVQEADRAAHTIDDLLELSRIEFGDDADFSDNDVVALVGEAVSRIAAAAEQAGVTVITDVPLGIVVHGDRRQLVSALFNLLDNAVKYSPEGSQVEVRAVEEEGKLVAAISVADRGVGIPRRSLDRIFERFYRVDRARSRTTGGTGLGLAIVRHVVSNHRGRVLAESVEGQGSTFTLLLPCLADGSVPEPDEPEGAAAVLARALSHPEVRSP